MIGTLLAQHLQTSVPHHGVYPWSETFYVMLDDEVLQAGEELHYFILAALSVPQVLHTHAIEQLGIAVPQVGQRGTVPLPQETHQFLIGVGRYGLAPQEHLQCKVSSAARSIMLRRSSSNISP